MADRNMTNYAKRVANPSQLIDGGDYEGRVRCRYDEITTDGASEVIGAKIFLGEILPGERCLGGKVVFEAMGAGATLAIGDAGSADGTIAANASRFMVAGSVAAAGTLDLVAVTGFGFKNTSLSPIAIFGTVGGATLAATKLLKVVMKFVRD